MAALSTFIRSTPPKLLRSYFTRSEILLPDTTWEAPEPEIARSLLRELDEMDQSIRVRLDQDFDRVRGLADEGGQTALYGVLPEREALDVLPSSYARALWVFLERPEAFRQAEEVRYTDDRRLGRMWDGFAGTPGLSVKRDAEALEAFRAGLRDTFEGRNVHVDVFDRHRPTLGDEDRQLVQATIYREGRPNALLEFVDGVLGHRSQKPVYEAAVTYEAGSGAIEVVANNREIRQGLARLFTRDLLAAELGEERLPLRRYSLAGLLRPRDFPTDPVDAIESVRVTLLRLAPIDASGERLTLECARSSERNIWQIAERRFGASSPLGGGWVVNQARLSILFHRQKGAGRGRVLPVTITVPHGSDLKDRTERERLIGSKYLKRWGLLEDM